MDAALPPGPRAPRALQMSAWLARPLWFARAPRALQMSAWLARPLWFASQCRARFGDMFTVRIEERPWAMVPDPAGLRAVLTAPPGRQPRGLHRPARPRPCRRRERDPAPDARAELGAAARRRRAPAPAPP